MRYFDVYRVNTQTLKAEPNPVFSIAAADSRAARNKANRQLLTEGRNKGFDLAWTEVRLAHN